MIILETKRLLLRQLDLSDASFILSLTNDPAWLRFIGDKNIRTIDDAKNYLSNGPMEMYKQLGFGLYLAKLKQNHIPIGICGLIKRQTLDDVDIGFAFLPQYRSQGYAMEASEAVLDLGKHELNMDRIVAIVSPENITSIKLLKKLGMRFEKTILLDKNTTPTMLFSIQGEGNQSID